MSRRLPDAPLSHGDEAEHRRVIALRANASLPKNGTHAMTQPLIVADFAVADLPDAALWSAGVVFVPDETGGATLAFSDGTSWRRTSDLAVVT